MLTRTAYRIGAVILMFGLAVPGIALANGNAKGCSLQGTWIGFDPLDNNALTGWIVSANGKSNDEGTNILEFPNFDPTLSGLFPSAVHASPSRGIWVRTGGNTFDYTMIAVAVDAAWDIVWVSKLSGHVTLIENCSIERIDDTKLEIYAPDQNPYTGTLMELPYGVPNPIAFGTHYGFRARVDLFESE